MEVPLAFLNLLCSLKIIYGSGALPPRGHLEMCGLFFLIIIRICGDATGIYSVEWDVSLKCLKPFKNSS